MEPSRTDPDDPSLAPELSALLATHDADAFESALDTLFAQRQQKLFHALGHLARDLHESIEGLARAASDAPAGAPDARRSLREALDMSAAAAHDNLGTIERLRPLAAALRDSARGVATGAGADPVAALHLACTAERFADDCLDDFTHMVERQAWQDLSGQRLQQVQRFIDRVEHALLKLTRITAVVATPTAVAQPSPRVTSQADVDRLLSEFGF